MAGKIPRAFIDDLLARIDIVELIDARVKLKKQGRNFGACCPFHNEKTPSFSVSPEKQFYHCFGCGVHGNAIDFVMEFDRLEFVEAIEELASSLGLDVPREQSNSSNYPTKNRAQKLALYELMEAIASCYKTQLRQSPQAIEYLKNRGLSGQTVAKFSIGYVPDSWDTVKRQFGQQPENIATLMDAGMLVTSEKGSTYDRFRHRIMFPIRGHKVNRGKIIGFGGRVLDNSTPKYLNSPETDIFRKGKELYGLYEALEHDKAPEHLVVVEGYMDVVGLAEQGIEYAVATLGTATTGEHIETLFRQTSKVICCYDGDRAGKDAAWRAMEQALPFMHDGRQLKFMFLPDGEDPDSIVRQEGKLGFEQRVSEAMSLSDFLFSTLMVQVDTSSAEGKIQISNLAIPLIDKVPTGALRMYLREQLRKKLRLMHDEELDALIAEKQSAPARKTAPEIKRTPMRTAISLLLQNPKLSQLLPEFSSLSSTPVAGLDLFVKLLEICHKNPNITTAQLLEQWRGDKQQALLAKLATYRLPFDQENTTQEFSDAVEKVLAQCVQQQIDKLQAKSESVGLSAEERQELWQLIQEQFA